MRNFVNIDKRKNQNVHKELDTWDSINWPMVNKQVTKLREQIFLAKLQGDLKRVRRLQKIAIGSKYNILSSIRRVTSVNRGKKTAGPDLQIYLTPERRFKLFQTLSKMNLLEWQPTPVRRIEIPRPGKAPRPLGIPDIKDRVVQMVVKNALEPEWEAIFEHGSYGFRPGRSAHDAMIRIWRVLSSKKRQWVLDADIKGCFNNIAHKPLLNTIGADFPAQDLIRKWLEAGYFFGNVFTETTVGTPQGGIISPLLANIALHGMEDALGVKYHTRGYIRDTCPFIPIRYADDFVVLARSEAEALRAQSILAEWLSARGMEFAPDKTAVRNALDGFDFLGWTFRLFPSKTGKAWLRAKGKLATLVRPSEKSVKALKSKLKEIWRAHVGKAARMAILRQNSILRGWGLYHKFVNSNETFREIDNFQYLQAVRYARRKHGRKSWSWIVDRYFRRSETPRIAKTGRITSSISNWSFFDDGINLYQLRSESLQNFASVGYGKNTLNPRDKEYFLYRKLKRNMGSTSFKFSLLKNQLGLCPICERDLISEDWDEPLHVHHLTPRKEGGKDTRGNLMLLHQECHQAAHRRDLTKEVLLHKLEQLSAKPLVETSYGARVPRPYMGPPEQIEPSEETL